MAVPRVGTCLSLLVLLVVALFSSRVAARTTLAPEERQHVKTIIAKLTQVKSGQHGNFPNNASLGVLPGNGNGFDDVAALSPEMSISPPYFDFGAHYTCISTSQDFELTNLSPDPNNVIEVYSITTGSLNFHVPNFNPSTLTPNQTKSVRVMFLPYAEGFASAVIVIQTSIGGFLLRVTGEGITNPYGVTGFTGIRVPIGIPYNPSVQIYNPFDEVLLIKEIFTSEGFLHLTLPDSVDDVDKVEEVNAVSTSASIWQVKPREIKDVIELSFRSHTPGPYRGFLHIKTNLDNLVVPIDIVVLNGGIHAMPEQLHFGAIVPGEPHMIPVTLLNSDRTPVKVLDVSTRNIDESISIEYTPGFVLPPHRSMSGAINVSMGRIASVNSTPPDGERSGYVVIRTNQSASAITKIPYSALFLRGHIGFQVEQLMFPLFKNHPQSSAETKQTNKDSSDEIESSSPKNHSIFTNRTIQLVNNFGVPLMMQSITLPDSHFGVNGLIIGSVAQPGEPWPPFFLHFNSGPKRLMYNTTLVFHTNVTMHRIPIQVYHGLLDVSTELHSDPLLLSEELPMEDVDSAPSDGKYFIDFGVIATNESRRRVLNLSNPNPIPITVYRISKTWKVLHLKFAGMYQNGASENANASYHKGSGLFVLEPHALTSFVVILKTPQKAKSAQSKTAINFYTSSGQIRVGARYEAVQGQLVFTPSNIRFESVFPGLVLRKSIFATNTYPYPLKITNVEAADPRIVIQYVSNTTLQSNVRSLIAEILFDPSRACTVNGTGLVERDLDFDPSVAIEQSGARINPNAGRDGLVSSFHSLEHMRGYRIVPDAISNPALALSGRPGCIDLLPYQYDTKRQFLIEEDVKALELRDINWAKQQASGQTSVKTSLRIDSTILSAQQLPVRATLKQPNFVSGTLDFGIVHTGKSSSHFVEVHNPASLAVQIQLVPPFEQFDDWVPPGDGEPLLVGEHGVSGSSVGRRRRAETADIFWLDDPVGGGQATRSIVMEPFSTTLLGPINFRPVRPELYVDTFYLRNNLTGVATVNVKGKGGRGEISLYDDGMFIPNLQQFLTAKNAANSENSHTHSAVNSVLKQIRFEIEAVHLNATAESRYGLVKTLRVWNRGTLPLKVVDVSFLPNFFAPLDNVGSHKSAMGVFIDTDALYRSLSTLQQLFLNVFYSSSRLRSVEGAPDSGDNEDEVGHEPHRFGACRAAGFEILDCDAQAQEAPLDVPSKAYFDLQLRLVPDCKSSDVSTLLQIQVQDGDQQQLLYSLAGHMSDDLMPECRSALKHAVTSPTVITDTVVYLCCAILVTVLVVSGREVYRAAMIDGTMGGFTRSKSAKLKERRAKAQSTKEEQNNAPKNEPVSLPQQNPATSRPAEPQKPTKTTRTASRTGNGSAREPASVPSSEASTEQRTVAAPTKKKKKAKPKSTTKVTAVTGKSRDNAEHSTKHASTRQQRVEANASVTKGSDNSFKVVRTKKDHHAKQAATNNALASAKQEGTGADDSRKIRRSKSEKERLEVARQEMMEMDRLRRQEDARALEQDANRLIELEKARKANSKSQATRGTRGWDQHVRDRPKPQSDSSTRVVDGVKAERPKAPSDLSARVAAVVAKTERAKHQAKSGRTTAGATKSDRSRQSEVASRPAVSPRGERTKPHLTLSARVAAAARAERSKVERQKVQSDLSARVAAVAAKSKRESNLAKNRGAKSFASAAAGRGNNSAAVVARTQKSKPTSAVAVPSRPHPQPAVSSGFPAHPQRLPGSRAPLNGSQASVPAPSSAEKRKGAAKADYLARLRAGRSLSIDEAAEAKFDAVLAASGPAVSTRTSTDVDEQRLPLRPSPVLAAVLNHATDEPVELDLGGLNLGNLLSEPAQDPLLSPIGNNSKTYRSPMARNDGKKPEPIGAPVGRDPPAGQSGGYGGAFSNPAFGSAFGNGPIGSAFGGPAFGSPSNSTGGGTFPSLFLGNQMFGGLGSSSDAMDVSQGPRGNDSHADKVDGFDPSSLAFLPPVDTENMDGADDDLPVGERTMQNFFEDEDGFFGGGGELDGDALEPETMTTKT